MSDESILVVLEDMSADQYTFATPGQSGDRDYPAFRSGDLYVGFSRKSRATVKVVAIQAGFVGMASEVCGCN